MRIQLWLMSAWVSAGLGCAAQGQVDISAAQVVRDLSAEVGKAMDEYRADLGRADEQREQLAIEAFINRVNTSVGQPEEQQTHAEKFRAALAVIRRDQQVSEQRYLATCDNLATLREVADGLHRMGLVRMRQSEEVSTWMSELWGRGEQSVSSR